MYFLTPDGNYAFAPSVDNLGGVMEPFNPMNAPTRLGASYQQSSLLPSDVGTPVIDMNVRMPDDRAVLSGIDNDNMFSYSNNQFVEPMIGYQLDLGGFSDPMLNGFGAVQDAVSVLSFVDLLARA